MIERKYGWVPDVPDIRDYKYAPVGAVELKDEVDLRGGCSAVEDQGTIGSCTAQALVGALEYLELLSSKPMIELSRLFLYYNERVRRGTVSEDSGATIRDGIKSLASAGVCSEELWGYDVRNLYRTPGAECYAEALTRRISRYERVNGLAGTLNALTEGLPVSFGIAVYRSFEAATDGWIKMPGRGERLLGGHAILAVGYRREREVLICRNSWGVRWGDAGYFYLPWAYAEQLGDDYWIIRT